MPCDTPCESGCRDNKIGDVEDFEAEMSTLRKQVEDLKAQLAEAGSQTNKDKARRNSRRFRSADWFGDGTVDIGARAIHIERYLNYGMTQEELTSGHPIIGIAQSGSDLAPCNRHHLQLAKRVREGIRSAGAIAIEFPTYPIQESTRRPGAALDRNLAYLTLVELLHGYPLDGVVLLTGCDKTTPAFLMAAATVNIPAICLNVGPMLNGWSRHGHRVGSGTVVWEAREQHSKGELAEAQVVDRIAEGTPSPGHCNTMGTASTMNALVEALGMTLPGAASIPAPYRERSQVAYQTGRHIVDMVYDDVKPCDILTRHAFENAIVANSAIGGSTNAPIHLNAIAAHAGVPLDLDDWDRIGHSIPLLLNMQPAGEMLSEDYHRAGGLPAILAELLQAGVLPHPDAPTVNGGSLGDNVRGRLTTDRRTIRSYSNPLVANAGFLHLKGTLFDSAIMKTSVVSPDFRAAFLENPDDPEAFEGKVAVFDGPEDFHRRLESADVDPRTIMVMRGTGPLGYPGAAEVVNMHAPSKLLRQGVRDLPCIGDGRQSGTSGSPSILNATPEAADGGNLALLRDGDRLRVDLIKRRVDILLPAEELQARRQALEAQGGYHGPPSQTPWQDLYRREVGGLSHGMILKNAVQFQRVAQKYPAPRANH